MRFWTWINGFDGFKRILSLSISDKVINNLQDDNKTKNVTAFFHFTEKKFLVHFNPKNQLIQFVFFSL